MTLTVSISPHNLTEQAWCWHHYGLCLWWMMTLALMTKVTLGRRESESLCAASSLFTTSPMIEHLTPWVRAGTGMEKTTRHLSYLPRSLFHSVSPSLYWEVSWDLSILSSHNIGADNDEIWNLSEMYLILYHSNSPQWIIIFVWTVRLVTDNSWCRGPGYPGTNPIFSPHISSSPVSTVLGSIKRSSSPDTR